MLVLRRAAARAGCRARRWRSRSASFLAFALADPDRRIAEWNVERYERTGKVDEAYLGRLSADAIPVLKGMRCVPAMPGRDGFGGINLGRERAIASGVTGEDCRVDHDWG